MGGITVNTPPPPQGEIKSCDPEASRHPLGSGAAFFIFQNSFIHSYFRNVFSCPNLELGITKEYRSSSQDLFQGQIPLLPTLALCPFSVFMWTRNIKT